MSNVTCCIVSFVPLWIEILSSWAELTCQANKVARACLSCLQPRGWTKPYPEPMSIQMIIILSRASEVGSPTNHLGSRQRQDTGPGIDYQKLKKNGPYTGPILLRQGEPGTSQYNRLIVRMFQTLTNVGITILDEGLGCWTKIGKNVRFWTTTH